MSPLPLVRFVRAAVCGDLKLLSLDDLTADVEETDELLMTDCCMMSTILTHA